MDTSETCIKMCDCEEIQSIQHEGDWLGNIYFGNLDIEPIGQKPHLFSNNFSGVTSSTIWLPRQDQLQGMVIVKVMADYAETDISPEHRLVTVFASFVDAVRFPYKIPQNDLTSMEQLWLAFVMSELYHKTWDGEKWK